MRICLILIILFSWIISTKAQDLCDGLPIVTFDGWQGDLNVLLNGFCVDDQVGLWYQEGLPTWRSHNDVPVYFSTRAIWQSQGVIERSAAYNGVILDGFEGAVALNSCEMVGSTVWIRRNNTEAFLRTVAADCAHVAHVYYHSVYVGSGIELQYELAQRLGMFEAETVGIYGFEVCTVLDVNQCVGQPIDYREWFLTNLRFR